MATEYRGAYTGAQMDANLAKAASSVQLTGDQSIGGEKTFTDQATFDDGINSRNDVIVSGSGKKLSLENGATLKADTSGWGWIENDDDEKLGDKLDELDAGISDASSSINYIQEDLEMYRPYVFNALVAANGGTKTVSAFGPGVRAGVITGCAEDTGSNPFHGVLTAADGNPVIGWLTAAPAGLLFGKSGEDLLITNNTSYDIRVIIQG